MSYIIQINVLLCVLFEISQVYPYISGLDQFLALG